MARTTWLEGEIKIATDKAILFVCDGREAWVPKSVILDHTDELEAGAEVEIELTELIAEEKGLL